VKYGPKQGHLKLDESFISLCTSKHTQSGHELAKELFSDMLFSFVLGQYIKALKIKLKKTFVRI
jgi:hypothetical protein